MQTRTIAVETYIQNILPAPRGAQHAARKSTNQAQSTATRANNRSIAYIENSMGLVLERLDALQHCDGGDDDHDDDDDDDDNGSDDDS